MKASANRAKGSKGPEDWKPPKRGYSCRYAIDWISIKNAWELTATEPEAAALEQMLVTCEPSQSLAVVRIDSPQPDASPSPAPVSGKTYASCGEGRGCPVAMVPSARDADGDGVVCER